MISLVNSMNGSLFHYLIELSSKYSCFYFIYINILLLIILDLFCAISGLDKSGVCLFSSHQRKLSNQVQQILYIECFVG